MRRAAYAIAFAAAAAFPAGAQSIAVNLGATNRISALPTDELTVPVIVDLSNAGATGLASLQAGLTWNSALLTFDSLRVAGGLSWVIFANTANAAGGVVTFNAFDAVALPGTATIANAYFTANGAQGGTRVDLNVTAAGNSTGGNVLPFVRPRSLDVCLATPGRFGDVNGDDAVNIIDAQQISRFTVGLSVANPTLLQQRGDVNQSGTVDIVDGQQIARFSVGLSAAPLIDTQGTFVQTATGVELTPGTNQTLTTGNSLQLFARPFASATTLTGCAPVTWQSSNTNVAAVNASGFVTAIGGGTATITALSGTASDMLAVAVSGSSSAPVASVSVSLATPTITVGSTTQASATLRDASNNLISNRPITWTSSNPSCATVNSTTGVVTGVSVCSANIIATAEGVSGQEGVSVMLASVQTVTVTLAQSSIGIGQMTQATAVLKDVGGTIITGRPITWSSSSTSRATVNSQGVVTGVSSGTATIRATVEGVTGQATVTVAMAPVASVAVELEDATVEATSPIRDETTATAILKDASGNVLTGRTVTWSSSNTSRATVNSSGVVTPLSAGTVDIRATSEGVTGLRTLTIVTPKVDDVDVELGSPSIIVGGTTTANAILRDAQGNVLTGRSVTFSMTPSGVVTVTSSGQVTGVANGTAVITATSEGKSGQATITVGSAPVTNEPPGMTMFTDRPFNCQKPTECESDWNFVGNFKVVSDATAPRSPQNVGEITFVAGFVGGSGPASVYPRSSSAKTMYISTYMKFSSNFQNHSTGINKVIHFYINGINRIFFQARGPSLAPSFGLQQLAAPYSNTIGHTGTAVHLVPNVVPNAVMNRGQWHHIEIVLVANTPGVADGSVQIFLDRTKVLDNSGIMFAAAGGNGRWEGINLNPTWGGSGDMVQSEMTLRVDHFYVSAKN